MTEQQYRERAQKLWEREGVIEFDRDAVVSIGDDIGAYVQEFGAEEDEEDLEDVPSPLDDNEPDEDEPL